MAQKPKQASGYEAGQVQHVRSTCLNIATKLGDLLDETVIVGGLVPSLLIDQAKLVAADDRHVGTLDLDVGLALALLDDQRYQALTERLRQAGFSEDANDEGKPTRQRWKIDGPPKVTVDFLIQPSLAGDRPGKLRNIEKDFAAIIAPGLHLAFVDRVPALVVRVAPLESRSLQLVVGHELDPHAPSTEGAHHLHELGEREVSTVDGHEGLVQRRFDRSV